MKTLHTSVFVLQLVSLFTGQCFAQSHVENWAAQRYNAASWQTIPEIVGVVSNWTPIVSASLLENASISTNREHSSVFLSTRYQWKNSPLADRIDLCVTETPDFTAAKRLLLVDLGGMQSIELMPRGTNGLEHLGDICFADMPEPSLVLFVRNNVFVSCFTSLDEVAVTNLLFSLDAQIVESLVDVSPSGQEPPNQEIEQ